MLLILLDIRSSSETSVGSGEAVRRKFLATGALPHVLETFAVLFLTTRLKCPWVSEEDIR